MSKTDDFYIRDDIQFDYEPEECEMCGDDFGQGGVFKIDCTCMCKTCYEEEECLPPFDDEFLPDYSDEVPSIEVSDEEFAELEVIFEDKDYSDEDINAIYDEAFPDGK